MTITAEIELSDDEAKLFEEYVDAHCLDAGKWAKRMLYGAVSNAVGRWKQPRGRVAAAFAAGVKSAPPRETKRQGKKS
jgi:hypothetical protein